MKVWPFLRNIIMEVITFPENLLTTSGSSILLHSLISFPDVPSYDKMVYLGDNCIQNFHLGRYIVGYTVGNLVLW